MDCLTVPLNPYASQYEPPQYQAYDDCYSPTSLVYPFAASLNLLGTPVPAYTYLSPSPSPSEQWPSSEIGTDDILATAREDVTPSDSDDFERPPLIEKKKDISEGPKNTPRCILQRYQYLSAFLLILFIVGVFNPFAHSTTTWILYLLMLVL